MELRILLVDENPVFRASVVRFLGRIPGANVVGQVPSVGDAHALLTTWRPDLVLMDVTAARTGCLEMARALQEAPLRPKVVCLSIYDDPQYRLASAELGNTFVSKADLVAELLPILEQLGLQMPPAWQPTMPPERAVLGST